jgi:phospholipase/lecithinase/hemolysin
MKINSIICLGDSYTIGESLPLHESFPYQVVQLLRKNGHQFYAPEIVAKTGWTSFELIAHLEQTKLNIQYDFATLLIGVNNQYRGLSTVDFAIDFEVLLRKAIALVGNKPKKVVVISIPDWGVTPFAKDNDASKITNEINAYNGVCELAAQKYQVNYVSITNDTRLVANDISLLANDQLHYSAKEHAIWATKVFGEIVKNID